MLIVTAYNHYKYKVQFLYSVFDFDNSGYIQTREIIAMFKTFVLANQKLRGRPLPDPLFLDRFAVASFSRSDLNSQTTINFHTLLSWVENNSVAMAIFASFQPRQGKIRQNYQVFRKFKHYWGKPFIDSIMEYHKAYNSIAHLRLIFSKGEPPESKSFTKLVDRDRPPASGFKLSRSSKMRPETQTAAGRPNTESNKGASRGASRAGRRKQDAGRNLMDKLLTDMPYYLAKFGRSLVDRKDKQILIINGAALTRREVFRIKDYYNYLCGRSREISSGEFGRILQNSLLSNHASSIFGFLDSKHRGVVNFEEFLSKMYPSLTESQLGVVKLWIQEHQHYLIAEKKEQQQPNPNKKRILPEACVATVRDLFRGFDEGSKGYLDFSDLRRVYRTFTAREVEEVLLKRAANPERGLTLEQFAGSIIPSDFQIPL